VSDAVTVDFNQADIDLKKTWKKWLQHFSTKADLTMCYQDKWLDK
jgi:hypothetical protein